MYAIEPPRAPRGSVQVPSPRLRLLHLHLHLSTGNFKWLLVPGTLVTLPGPFLLGYAKLLHSMYIGHSLFPPPSVSKYAMCPIIHTLPSWSCHARLLARRGYALSSYNSTCTLACSPGYTLVIASGDPSSGYSRTGRVRCTGSDAFNLGPVLPCTRRLV